MKVQDFQWDDGNIFHISRHQVDPQEAEEACYNQPFVLKGRQGRYLVYGQTDEGRYLLIVGHYLGKGTLRIITARDMTSAERKLYKKRG